VAALVAAGGAARAQEVETFDGLRAQAQESFQHGRARDALVLARRAAAIRVEPRLLRFMAVMHYELGEVSEAVDHAERCVLASQSSDDPTDRSDTLVVCQRMADELGSQVARIVVRVPQGRRGSVRVRVAGAEVAASRWGAPLAVAPGEVAVEVDDGGAPLLRRRVTVVAGGREVVEVPERQVAHVVAPPRPPPQGPSVSVAPWVVAGAGAVVFVVGNLFILGRDGAVDDRDRRCPGAVCQSDMDAVLAGQDDERAHAWQTAAYVTAGLGAAAMVGGVAWGVVGLRHATSRRAAWTPMLRTTATEATLGLQGRF